MMRSHGDHVGMTDQRRGQRIEIKKNKKYPHGNGMDGRTQPNELEAETIVTDADAEIDLMHTSG